MNEKNIDELLSQGLVQVPEEFHSNVMLKVTEYERNHLSVGVIATEAMPLTWWQWSAVIAGSVLGIGQVLRFVFSVWLVTAAG